MIKSHSCQKNVQSIYICDSCLKEMTTDERILIDKNTYKKYDLCKDCWRKIRIIVEKHKLKKG